MKKIGIIGIRGLPAMYGAFDRFVEQFVNDHDIKNEKVIFFISCDYSFKEYQSNYKNVRKLYVKRGDGFFILISYFISFLKMYFHGVRTYLFFGYGAAPLFFFMKILNCRIVCNPDGIEWRRPEGKIKKIYFKLCERLFSKINVIRIFDSKVIEKYYNINFSAYGTTIYYPSIFENEKIKFKKSKKFERFYIIGRLLEENNTETIVRAFTKLSKDKKLYIIGKSNKYFEEKIQPLVYNAKNIIHLGPIYDQKKLFKVCSYFDYYVHGHSVGGTNPTLIEAVNLQKPIIAFNTSFNNEILEKNAKYFRNEKELFDIINNNYHHNINLPIYKNEFTSKYINNAYYKLITDKNNL